jgi:hypothetical protein
MFDEFVDIESRRKFTVTRVVDDRTDTFRVV